jgi:hypothetical protein
MQQILASLDIPPLEPVPDDHVLTKSFFLLDDFPGRYADGPLWVEAIPDTNDPADSAGARRRRRLIDPDHRKRHGRGLGRG